MDAALTVAAIVGIFFVAGLVVGGIVVIALPVLRERRSRRDKQDEPGDHTVQPEFERVHRDERPRWPDERPRWPGDGDNGYSGR